MRLEVTEEDIKNGVPLNSASCALALAFDRAIQPKEGHRISVGLHTAYVLKEDSYRGSVAVCTYDLPVEATLFISRFDRDKGVTPSAFEVKKREGSDADCPE